MSGINDNSNSSCPVCYKNAEYYSIGMCEHAVCYECSTRMRVLCQQNECPICRQDLPKVVFTAMIKPFRFLKKGNLLNTKYSIYFENVEVQNKFIKLLAHTCNLCANNEEFSSFNNLSEHVKRKHNLYYCDLCVDNLKIFSHERQSYTKPELSRHRRKGDIDDKSHKGHPLCQFCGQRYMDNDELYRHLRRDHLFCHFCDADGLHQYYNSYYFLREHFRQEHHLCEEGDCADEQFTSVFRTDIDLKAHKANIHGKQLGKAATKQARTLELEFTLAPRGELRTRRGPPGTTRISREHGGYDGNANFSRGQLHPYQQAEAADPEPEPTFIRQPLVDVQSTEQFPTLGSAVAPHPVPNLSHSKGRGNLTISGHLSQGNYDQNFPALGPDSSGPNVGSASESSISKTLNFSLSSSNKTVANGKQQGVTPNLSIHVNHRPNGTVTTRLSGTNLRIKPGSSRDSDFPALGKASGANATTSTTNQSWTKVTCVKPTVTPRREKIAPLPLAPSPPPLRSGEDFPSLSKSFKGGKGAQTNAATPINSAWVANASSLATDATKGKAKKKKMKQLQVQGVPSNGNISSNKSNSSSKTNKTTIESSQKKTNFLKTSEQNNKDKESESSKTDKSKIKQNLEQSYNGRTADEGLNNKFEVAGTVSATALCMRSELKIDGLNITNNNNLSSETNTASSLKCKDEDFPALRRTGSRPPGLSSPPPGLGPPPGFLNRLNGLTFTNSSGESYTIVPDEGDQQKHGSSYLPPKDFQRRNQRLIAEFNSCFGSEESEELKAFRYLSGLFRTGVCDADEYYKQCRTVMGSEAFQRLFAELLVLLPDIHKQRELFEVHRRETCAGTDCTKGLEVCDNCGQILRSSDLQTHATSHILESQFPALGKIQTYGWSKK